MQHWPARPWAPGGGCQAGRSPAPVRSRLGRQGWCPKRRRPRQRGSGARIDRYRCCLPALAGFSIYRRGGANGATMDTDAAVAARSST